MTSHWPDPLVPVLSIPSCRLAKARLEVGRVRQAAATR